MRNFCCNSTSTIHIYKDMYKRMASRFHKLRTFREREKKKKKATAATLSIERTIPGFLKNWMASRAEEA